jgi:pimeloyl-ACP methyl ester carboxylesterase
VAQTCRLGLGGGIPGRDAFLARDVNLMSSPLYCLERVVVGLLTSSLVALTAISAGGCAQFEPVTAAELERGYILMLPGVANKPSSMAGIARGLRDAGIDQAIDRELWGDRPFGELKNVRALKRNRTWAAEEAARLVEYRRNHPDRPMTLIGYSGGGGIALFVCESLPEDVRIDRVILLSPAVSPDYDLAPALAHCRRGIVSYYSEKDWLNAVFLTEIFGTMDRKKTFTAGSRGFLNGSGRLAVKDGLTQVGWTPAWRRLGHDGGHLGYESREWARAVVAPVLLEDASGR